VETMKKPSTWQHPDKSREEDIALLDMLHKIDKMGMSHAKAADFVNARYGTKWSRNAAIGIVSRVNKAHAAEPCKCVKPENKDGGQKPLWWWK